MSFESDVILLASDVVKLHTVIHGSADTTVVTDGGTVKTLAGALRDLATLNPRGAWAASTVYALKDVVLEGGAAYVSLAPHTSGSTFAGDAAKWLIVQDPMYRRTLEAASNLGTLVTALGSARATIVLDRDTTLTGNLSLPSSIRLSFINGARILRGAYTISCPAGQQIDSSDWPVTQVFTGTGAVTGLNLSRPEFWGALGDGTTDDSTAFNAMPGSTTVLLSDKTYIVESFGLKSYTTYKGGRKTILKLKPGSTAKNLAEGTSLVDVVIDGIGFDGNSANVTAGYSSAYLEDMLYLFGGQNVLVTNCRFNNYLSYGIMLNGSNVAVSTNILVEKCRFTAGGKGGISCLRYGSNIKYLNNYLYNSCADVNGVNFWKPMEISGTIDGEMAGNTVIQDNGAGGEVIVEYKDRQSENIRIHHNYIKGQGWGSNVKIAASVGISVYDNDLISPHYMNVYIEGCADTTVSHNRMFAAGMNAVVTAQDAQTLRDNYNLVIANNIIKDSNRLGSSVGRAVATVWSAGLAVVAQQVVYYGDNTYLATGAGTTGATPPTHVAGDVSDGTVTWRFLTANASATAAPESYVIRIGSTDKVLIVGNTYNQEDLTVVANGLLVSATNYMILDNDFLELSYGVMAFDNHFSSTGTNARIENNQGFQTTDKGLATLLAGTTQIGLDPAVVAEGTNLVIQATLKSALNGTVAYIYAAGATPPAATVYAKNAAHGAPTVSSDIDISWSVSVVDANGTFGKTSK